MIKGDKIKLVKPMGAFTNVGEVCEVTDVSGGGVISFRFGEYHLGCMSYDEFEKYFELIQVKGNKYWNEENGVHELHFIHFCDDEVILKFVEDNDDDDDGTFSYTSKLLNIEQDWIFADDIEDVKEALEEKVVEYIKDQITYYEEMLYKFEEE